MTVSGVLRTKQKARHTETERKLAGKLTDKETDENYQRVSKKEKEQFDLSIQAVRDLYKSAKNIDKSL